MQTLVARQFVGMRRWCVWLARPNFAIFFLAFSTFLPLFSSASRGQATAEVVGPTGRIPQDHFKTWSLFLVCNPEWLAPAKSQDLYFLYQQFKVFGRTIGDDNLAVWFWKSTSRSNDPKLAENVDVERSIRLCKAFQLKPSSSPHLVVTMSYPDESKPPKDVAYFELVSMKPTELAQLLDKLTDQLLLQGKVTADTTDTPGLWIRLLDAAQRTIGSFGCAWSFKIQTGILTADLHSCGTQ